MCITVLSQGANTRGIIADILQFKCRRHTEEASRQNIIAVGQLTTVHKLSDGVVRKLPSDKTCPYSKRSIQIESQIYRHLGRKKRIARCLECTDDYLDLRYERHGDLESYLKNNPVTDQFRYRAARQAIEAVDVIHRKQVIHSDLSARQFLVDESLNLRLSDFGGSSLHGSEALVMENATHFLPRDEDAPNTVQSDIFALGSTIYEITKSFWAKGRTVSGRMMRFRPSTSRRSFQP
jgi:serine/threonine protein kinase